MKGLCYKVIALHEEKNLSWEEVSSLIPFLPRGWYELSAFSKEDRIEFTKQYWLTKFSFMSSQGHFLEERLLKFFEKIEDIGIFAAKETKNSPFDVYMVYSLKEDEAFFQGGPPANEEVIFNLKKQFESVHFPIDYLGFLQIHDGFSKYSDIGVIKTKEMAKTYIKFQELTSDELLLSAEGVTIDTSSLIPFYESENLHSYQCFYTDWFPEDEMGNICYNDDKKHEAHLIFEEGISFPNFLSWLLNYLYSS